LTASNFYRLNRLDNKYSGRLFVRYSRDRMVVEEDVVASVMSSQKKHAQVQIRLKCLAKRPVVKSCIIGVD